MKKLYGIDVFLVALLAVTLWHFNLEEYNFGVVERGKIYRSAQPDKQFLEKMKTEYGLKTIVVVGGGIKDFEKKFAQTHDITIYSLPMSTKKAPSDELVNRFLKIVRDEKLCPMLIHCKAGADRTGLMIAIKRIEIDNWTLKQAKREMRRHKYIALFHPTFNKYLKKRYEALTKNPR